MASCINCGRELGSSESFCENCGYPVPGSSSNTYNDTIIRKEILTESSSPPKLMMEHLKPVSNFKLKNLLFLLPVVIISAALLIYFNNRPEKADNSLDNLQNGGYAAIQGNWIYYSANGGLYKMNSRSGSSTKITDGYYKSIGAMDDWIYFLGDSGDGILNFNKIKSDGSEKTGTDSIPIFTAADEEYFCKIFDGYFYKTSKDGTEIRLPLDTAESLLAVDGEKIYTLKPEYNTSDSSRGNVKIYQSDKDFKNKKLVFDKDLSSLGGNIHIQNNQIYFIDTVNSSNYTSLSAYNITTKSSVKLAEGKIRAFNISSGLIYFIDDNTIFKMGLGSKTKTKVFCLLDVPNGFSYTSPVNLFIVGNWIFYCDNEGLYRMKKDGSSFEGLGPLYNNHKTGLD